MTPERESTDHDLEDECALPADFAHAMMDVSGGLLLLDRALAARPLDLDGARAHLQAARAGADLATKLARRIIMRHTEKSRRGHVTADVSGTFALEIGEDGEAAMNAVLPLAIDTKAR